MENNPIPPTNIMINNSSFNLISNVLSLKFSLNGKQIPIIEINTNEIGTSEEYRDGILYSNATSQTMIAKNFYIKETNIYKVNDIYHYEIKCIVNVDHQTNNLPTSFHSEIDEIV